MLLREIRSHAFRKVKCADSITFFVDGTHISLFTKNVDMQ